MVLLPDNVSTEPLPSLRGEGDYSTPTFDVVYRAEFPRLAGALYAMSGVRSLAEDVAQDAFAHAWSRWPRVCKSPSPVGWVYVTAFRLLKRRTRRWQQTAISPVRDPPDSSQGTDQRIDLLQALRTLPSSQQQVVVLRHILGLSTIEVAQRLDTTEIAVRSTLHRAVVALRGALNLSSQGVDDGN